jgi:hypothetical protein
VQGISGSSPGVYVRRQLQPRLLSCCVPMRCPPDVADCAKQRANFMYCNPDHKLCNMGGFHHLRRHCILDGNPGRAGTRLRRPLLPKHHQALYLHACPSECVHRGARGVGGGPGPDLRGAPIALPRQIFRAGAASVPGTSRIGWAQRSDGSRGAGLPATWVDASGRYAADLFSLSPTRTVPLTRRSTTAICPGYEP